MLEALPLAVVLFQKVLEIWGGAAYVEGVGPKTVP